ncbi:hypothetical protein [Agromyces larvae]|uniref:DUF3325 domain-containing protein n=1 Tax=Agromyces larvae TaxID=2929802 RepID=A0ABY4BUS3_9MICO|nr:hypothetical protein [Agromyces larvae]UOE42900.1 hypothetical protein MTO99_11950 [Agromyces larvae]
MLIAAGILMAVLGIAHSILGERHVIGFLLAQERLPPIAGGRSVAAGTIRFAWHVTSVLAIAIALALVLIGVDASLQTVVAGIGWTLIACALLPIVYTRGRHPSWAIFVVAGGLCAVSALTSAV